MIKNSAPSLISDCRICHSSLSRPVFDLGSQALTGLFVEDGASVERHKVSLSICVNPDCQLVQINEVYDLNLLYGDHYGYESSLNPSMRKHLSKKIQHIKEKTALFDDDVVIDIGSNDATSLSFYPDNVSRIGVDPTGIKFVNTYRRLEISLVDELFPSEKLDSLLDGRKVRVFSSFACFYDLPDPVLFARSIHKHLAEDGLWYLEQSYLPTMLSTTAFDTVCHEHIEYYTLGNIQYIAGQVGLEVKSVEFNDVNGGSFSVSVGHKNSLHPVDPTVNEILSKEAKINLLDEFREFKSRVEKSKSATLELLNKIQGEGKKIFGLGASTKGNVLLQYYGIDSNLIECIGDVNPNKYGSETPGTSIPIISEDRALEGNADYYIVLPWHFKEFFLTSEKFKGRTLIFPLPELSIVIPKG